MTKVFKIANIFTGLLFAGIVNATAVDDLQMKYQTSGAAEFDAERGNTLWHKEFPDPDAAGKIRGCSLCHTSDLHARGKHARTGKVIEPMAPSVNTERLTDPKKIEKWFNRNCKWVIGRACTPQEKGDILQYLMTQ